MDITPYLKLLVDKTGSDLFFTAGSPVKVKIEGIASAVGKTVLDGELTKAAAYTIMSDAQIEAFEEHWECDFAIALPDKSARFRVNVFKQRGEVGMVLRRIPLAIPTIDELGYGDPEDASHVKAWPYPYGRSHGFGQIDNACGDDYERNSRMSGHILTIEDPVEFSHPHLKSIINQREVGVDTKTYANALKASLREAPDVILVGEIRERETMEAALELCNTGHLCLSTMHANNANQAMERVINMFPQELHKQLFLDMSLNIRAVISQRLVSGVDGKRVAAIEIMINTPHVGDLILKGNLEEIKEAMDGSGAKGMQTFDMALYNLFKEERIDLEEASAMPTREPISRLKSTFG